MAVKLIRINTVVDMTGKSRSAIYADIASGNFPNSISIGARSVAWNEAAINEWIRLKMEESNAKKLKPIEKLARAVPTKPRTLADYDIWLLLATNFIEKPPAIAGFFSPKNKSLRSQNECNQD